MTATVEIARYAPLSSAATAAIELADSAENEAPDAHSGRSERFPKVACDTSQHYSGASVSSHDFAKGGRLGASMLGLVRPAGIDPLAAALPDQQSRSGSIYDKPSIDNAPCPLRHKRVAKFRQRWRTESAAMRLRPKSLQRWWQSGMKSTTR